jgi:poly-gamma-glutamate synthesis protein (capsule biosynthesis protein)
MTLVDKITERRISGITVPHHIPALDLIARGFMTASSGEYERIIVLTPDHFRRSTTPFATTDEGFSTDLGPVNVDKRAVQSLVQGCPLVELSRLFDQEHGLQILLPFLAAVFPGVEILPVALRLESTEKQWICLADALDPLFTENTLIVQSTDFSHYLMHREARRHDQQTLNALALSDPKAILTLRQPQHIDSKAAQYVHMELQKRRGNKGPIVIGNRNSQQYSPVVTSAGTTSYIVQVFEKAGAPERAWPNYPDSETWIFAGDAFLGRAVSRVLTSKDRNAALRQTILGITGGHPIALNLEGVLLPRMVRPELKAELFMDERVSVNFLKSINVKIAGLANNHSLDAGKSGLDNTAALLRANGIIPVSEGEVVDAGRFRLTALTDLCNKTSPLGSRITPRAIQQLALDPALRFPAFAFVHWGKEFSDAVQPSQIRIAKWIEDTAISLICGSHPHVSSTGLASWKGADGLVAWTLGNFLFDQPQGSGALLEVRIFDNATYATRWLAIPNLLYEKKPEQALTGEP